MSGSGAQKRSQSLAIRCAKLSKALSHREIAAVVGKRPEQIKALVILGERLLQAKGE